MPAARSVSDVPDLRLLVGRGMSGTLIRRCLLKLLLCVRRVRPKMEIRDVRARQKERTYEFLFHIPFRNTLQNRSDTVGHVGHAYVCNSYACPTCRFPVGHVGHTCGFSPLAEAEKPSIWHRLAACRGVDL